MNTKKRAIFLDRDGVLLEVVVQNGMHRVPLDWSEVKILPGVPEALSMFREDGFLQIVVTNQSEVGRGLLQEEVLNDIHHRISNLLPTLDAIFVCPHDGEECDCKKPRPGLVHQAAKQWDFDAERSYVIGDRWRDMDLGKNIGAKTILVDSPAQALDGRAIEGDYSVTSLLEAAKLIRTLE